MVRATPANRLVIERHIDNDLQRSREFRRLRSVTGTGIGGKACEVDIAGEKRDGLRKFDLFIEGPNRHRAPFFEHRPCETKRF